MDPPSFFLGVNRQEISLTPCSLILHLLRGPQVHSERTGKRYWRVQYNDIT